MPQTLPSIHSLDLPFLRGPSCTASPSSFVYRRTSTSSFSTMGSRSPSPASSISSSSASSFSSFSTSSEASVNSFDVAPASTTTTTSFFGPPLPLHASYDAYEGYDSPSCDMTEEPHLRACASFSPASPFSSFSSASTSPSSFSSGSYPTHPNLISTPPPPKAPITTTSTKTTRKASTQLRLAPCPFDELDAVILVPAPSLPSIPGDPPSPAPPSSNSSFAYTLSPPPGFAHTHTPALQPFYPPHQRHSLEAAPDAASLPFPLSSHPLPTQPPHPNPHPHPNSTPKPLILTGRPARAFRHASARRAVGALRVRVHPYRVVGGSYSGIGGESGPRSRRSNGVRIERRCEAATGS